MRSRVLYHVIKIRTSPSPKVNCEDSMVSTTAAGGVVWFHHFVDVEDSDPSGVRFLEQSELPRHLEVEGSRVLMILPLGL